MIGEIKPRGSMMSTAFETYDYDNKCAAAAEAWINNTRYRVAYPEYCIDREEHYNPKDKTQEKRLRKQAVKRMMQLIRSIENKA